MRRLLLALIISGLVAVGVTWAADVPQLTEMQRLKAQLQQTQEQLVQAQYALATCQAQAQAGRLSQSRQTLEQEWAVPGWVFDWTTLTFTQPPSGAPR